MRLKDRVAIITGAAAGIGKACAERFAREGAKVVLADINREGVEAAAAAIGAAGGTATAALCDVGDRAEVEALVAKAVKTYGSVDVQVSNAGVIHAADFLDLTEADFDRVLRVNLKGVFLCGQAAARQMVRQGRGGVIINMSSINAVLAIPNQIPYVVSKGGVNQLTRVMALALIDKGIRVNAIGAGTILTDIARGVITNDEARRKVLSRTPIGRFGDVAEVAAVAVFLASDDSSYIVGQTIYPDGGRLALNYTVAVPQ